MKKVAILVFIALFLGLVIFAYAQKEMEKTTTAAPTPAEELTRSIESGKMLFNDVSLGKSGTSCNSCHLNGGATEGIKMGDMNLPAWDNLGAKYPRYFGGTKRVMTLEQVVIFCLVNPLKGEVPTWDDQKLTDLTAYVASVKPMEKKMEMKK
jgi:cytochrome c